MSTTIKASAWSSATGMRVLVAVALLFAINGIWRPYSYWLDELFSVAASNETLHGLFHAWILVDVHPPLYQLALKLWISLFGISEPATRSLSLLSTVGIMAWLAWRFFDTTEQRLWLLLVCTTPFFGNFAQEARPYGILLALAALALQALVTGKDKRFLLILVIMSLTHYFGLILAGSLIFVGYFMRGFWSPRGLLASAAIVIWPLCHILLGDILGLTGGNFWIQVDGLGGTVGNLFAIINPVFEFMQVRVPAIWIVYLLLLLALLVFFIRGSFVRDAAAVGSVAVTDSVAGSNYRNERYIAWALLLFFAAIAVVDQFSPLSTKRNFYVALPLLYWLFVRAAGTQVRWQSGLLLLLCAAQLLVSYVLLAHRQQVTQNYRGAAVEMMNADAGQAVVQLSACHSKGGHNDMAMNTLYLRQIFASPRTITRVCESQLGLIAPGSKVISCRMPDAHWDEQAKALGYRIRSLDQTNYCQVLTRP